jgi:hypothetical protein
MPLPNASESMETKKRHFIKAALLGTPALLANAQSRHSNYHFVLVGDSPYSKLDEFGLQRILQEATPGASFVVHIGDIKSGSERCDDDLINRRLGILDSSPIPLIYTPGDNEWVDCKSADGVVGYPLERLAFLRKLAFSKPESLGKKTIVLEQQTSMPENRRWDFQGISHLTLNIPGSNNGLEILPNTHISQRTEMNAAWLNESVSRAIVTDKAGLVIALHANIGVDNRGFLNLKGKALRAYGEFRDHFFSEVKRFAKPILLLHGDSHRFSVDYPAKALPNLQRVEAFGFPFTSSWARISVEHQNPALFVVNANHL